MTAVILPPCRACGWRPDSGEFWREPIFATDKEDVQEKYSLVVALERIPESERRPGLRHVADRWPGALREAELVSPEEMQARRRAAYDLVAGASREGGGPPREAVVLWHELHRLLHDQRALRAGGEAAHEDVNLDRLIALDRSRARREGQSPRWPAPDHLRALTGAKVRPRQAYLWLAARAGLTLAALHSKLFLRVGRWDLRPEDPAWSRDPSVSG